MAKVILKITSVTTTVDTICANLVCVEDNSPGEKQVRSYNGSLQLSYPLESAEAKQLIPGNELILEL